MAILLSSPLLAWQDETRPASPETQEPSRPRVEQLPEGVRVEAKGRILSPGILEVGDLELVPPGARDEILGPIDSVDPDASRLVVLGIRVDVPRTAQVRDEEGEDIGLASLEPGAWVEVEGHQQGFLRVRARRVRVSKPRSRVSVLARIEEIEVGAEYVRLLMLGLEVRVRPRTRVDVPESLTARDLASLVEEPPSLRRRTEEDFIPGTIVLAEGLTLGGAVTVEVEREEDTNLESDGDRDQTQFALRNRVEGTWRPRKDIWVVAGASDTREWELKDERDNETDSRTVLRETFVYARDFPARRLDVELGRLHFKDDRQWIFDRDLDGVRVGYELRPFHIEASVTSVLLGGEREEIDKETTNFMGFVTFDLEDLGEIAAYVIDREDRQSDDDSPFFLGARGKLEPISDVVVWFDGAWATGVDDEEHIQGYGFDVGGTWVLPGALEPSFTLGYAFGSGGDDDPSDGNSDFRQTGLQDNVDKWNGVTSFHFYGEVFDPELSNLEVLTAGFGFRPARRTSLDAVVHRYRQAQAADFLRSSELRASPDGEDEYLGWEWDVILGWRQLPFLDLEIVAGRFYPGDAFAGDTPATFLKFETRFKF
jgi:alginate production protein